MSKFNQSGSRPRVSGPITGANVPTGRTHQGGPGYARDAKSELFLLAVTNMVGEKTFYESTEDRDDRYANLVRHCAVNDPEWTYNLLRWLRGPEGNLRSASIVGAAEFVRARTPGGLSHEARARLNRSRAGQEDTGWNRKVVRDVLQRADEPGEFLAYWTSNYGKRLPMAVKRGVADAIRRLYTEYNFLKWDSDKRAWRFADALELTHAAPRAGWQGDLFKHAIDLRHGREIPADDVLALTLPMIYENVTLREDAREAADYLLVPNRLTAAGMTWEDVLSLAGGKIDKKSLWETLIDADALGYMALLRNLRNFDEANVSAAHARKVGEMLSDPARVAKSRQLPLRFLSAYRAAPNLRWGPYLELALQYSMGNVPELPGRTLVLIDTSGSMGAPMSDRSQLRRWDAAAAFGLAVAGRAANADVVSYSHGWGRVADSQRVFPQQRGESLLRAISRFEHGYFIGGGTDTAGAIARNFKGHDRIVLLTDEQSATDVERVAPEDVPLFTFNLAGYRYGHVQQNRPNRHTMGGLTDAGFKVISLLSRGKDAPWPWEIEG